MMKISVLVHNINRASILGECLESVASQTYRPLEAVILDAGSTDGSLEVIAEKRARLKAAGIEVRVEQVPLTGVATSRNMAARAASGDLLCFLDNDALFESPQTLEKAARAFFAWERLGVVTFRVLKADTDGLDYNCWVYRRPSARWSEKAFETFTFVGGGCMIRSRAFRECGGFWDELGFSREEEELALGLIDRDWHLIYLPSAAIRHFSDPRGRAKAGRHRFMELQNGMIIFWRRMPRAAALLVSLARVGSMSLRALLKDRLALGPLLASVPATVRLWKERGLTRSPVSYRSLGRYLARHRGHELDLLGPEGRGRGSVLGFPFDRVDFGETVEAIRAAVAAGRRLHVITGNVDHVMIARNDPEMREDWAKAGLVVADGVPILWAARLLGGPLKGRVNGTDLVWACAGLSAREGFPLALIGSAPEVARAAAERMREKHPRARIAVIPTPHPLTPEDSQEIVAEVRRIGARVLLVGLGAPKQQRWIETYLEPSGAHAAIGIGGALEFIAGVQKRAPLWMQKHGLEWLHRMVQDPRRLARRYLIEDLPFFWLLFKELLPGSGRRAG